MKEVNRVSVESLLVSKFGFSGKVNGVAAGGTEGDGMWPSVEEGDVAFLQYTR